MIPSSTRPTVLEHRPVRHGIPGNDVAPTGEPAVRSSKWTRHAVPLPKVGVAIPAPARSPEVINLHAIAVDGRLSFLFLTIIKF